MDSTGSLPSQAWPDVLAATFRVAATRLSGRADCCLLVVCSISLVRQLFTLLLLWALSGAPFFRRMMVVLGLCLLPAAAQAADVISQTVPDSDFVASRDALIESIESEGLVVSARIPFNRMLERTADTLGNGAPSPFAQAEIIQFCSSVIAWQLLAEAAENIALCPLSITVFVRRSEPDVVVLAYRSPGTTTPARRAAENLLRRLVDRSSQLARLR